ncbi:hypothetical protein MGU_11703 [Metarhizium guizhouense ARSEF 977]|uniref:Uncharacterized protein n=1 Tax=Metarhizium guizhouense (strain ARSEF 977) TaxID=1276136 RepID=A0A0B4GTL9_METGA|nr:hypothetical protein MGU_11703 [Metarhizium guizhouense ARSEF 977]
MRLRVKIDYGQVTFKQGMMFEEGDDGGQFSESDIDAEDYANLLLSPALPRGFLEQLGAEPDSESEDEEGNGERDNAITVHKSQSITEDKIVTDLSCRDFQTEFGARFPV